MLSFVILHSKRCLECILQFPTPSMQGHEKARALAIYVVICHFTFKKVSRIPHTSSMQGHEKARALAPKSCALVP